MKKTGLLFTAALLSAAMLSACGYNTYGIEKVGDVSEASKSEVSFEETVTLKAELPTEDFLMQTDYYYLYDDESGEYGKVLFKVDYTVTDFKFFTVKSQSVSTQLIKDEIIFTKRTLTPDKPLVVDVKTDVGSAVRGISFTDPDGKVHYYAIRSVSSSGITVEQTEMLDCSGLKAEFATAELLESTDSYISYEDKKEEYSKIAYRLSGKVTNFRFLSIEPVDTDKEDGKYKIAKVLHTIEEFDSEKAFVAETAFADVYPMRGISFVDEHGVTRYFTVSDEAVGNGKIFIDEVPPMIEK